MKTSLLLLMFVLSMVLWSCEKDNDPMRSSSCLQDSWIGEYVGYEECSESFPGNGIVKILEAGDEVDEFLFNGNVIKFIDCEFEVAIYDTLFKADVNFKFEILSGDSIKIHTNVTPPDLGYNIFCNYWGGK